MTRMQRRLFAVCIAAMLCPVSWVYGVIWHPDGVQIRHWTSADLHRFYREAGYSAGLYQEPAESEEPGLDGMAIWLELKHRNQNADVERGGERPVLHLTVAMLNRLLKKRVNLSPIAWASADYHKDKLSPSLLVLLKERVDREHDGLVPESLKAFLSECSQQSPSVAPPVHPVSPGPPAICLETVLRQGVLSEADTDQLYGYRDQLTRDQVVDALFRMDQDVSRETMQRWQLLLGEKYQQDSNTNPPWFDGSDEAMEAMGDIKDAWGDLLSETL